MPMYFGDSILTRRNFAIAAFSLALCGCGPPKPTIIARIDEIRTGKNAWRIDLNKRRVFWKISFDPYGVMPSSALDSGRGEVVVRWHIENAGAHPLELLLPEATGSKMLPGFEKTEICRVPLSNLVYSTASFSVDSCTTNDLEFFVVLDADADVRLSRPVEIWASPEWP